MVDYLKIAEIVLTIFVIPLGYNLIRIHTKIIVLETTLENKKEMFDTIFKKLEENREDLHQVNLKTEKILSTLEKKEY